MSFFSNIKQSLENIDYACNKPQTYLVLVPVLSLTIQKIQLATTLPLISNVNEQNPTQANANSRKFANICKWHLTGSTIQLAASIIAIKAFAVPLFSIISLLAAYELTNTLIKSFKNTVTLYDLDQNGGIKQINLMSAWNIFF